MSVIAITRARAGSFLASAEERPRTRLGAHGVRCRAPAALGYDVAESGIAAQSGRFGRVQQPPKAPGSRPTLPHVAPEGAETWFASTTAHFCTIQRAFSRSPWLITCEMGISRQLSPKSRMLRQPGCYLHVIRGFMVVGLVRLRAELDY
jgi:hypothetical protein